MTEHDTYKDSLEHYGKTLGNALDKLSEIETTKLNFQVDAIEEKGRSNRSKKYVDFDQNTEWLSVWQKAETAMNKAGFKKIDEEDTNKLSTIDTLGNRRAVFAHEDNSSVKMGVKLYTQGALKATPKLDSTIKVSNK